jgi:hypothetical protein
MKTKHILLSLFTFLLLTGCSGDKSKDNDPSPGGGNGNTKDSRVFSGEWVAVKGGAGGFNEAESYKNYQLEYEVEGSNQEVTFTLESSDINVAFMLYHANGERMGVSRTGRNPTDTKTLNSGKYRIAILAERNGLGKFKLTIGGIKKDIVQVPSETLKSGEKNWGEYGGGGRAVTPKNHIYSFEVTEDNTWVDIEMNSKDTEIALYVSNANKEIVAQAIARRSHYHLLRFNKGSYSIMAATDVRGSRGSYTLDVYGKVKNLSLVEYQTKVIEGNWINDQDLKIYDIEVTENNNFDFEISSPATGFVYALHDSNGNQLSRETRMIPGSAFGSGILPSGKYRFYAQPYGAGNGNFKIVIVGKIKV